MQSSQTGLLEVVGHRWLAQQLQHLPVGRREVRPVIQQALPPAICICSRASVVPDGATDAIVT